MLTYEEMQYLVFFAQTGTLSAVAQQYNISQPTITRAMKKAEAEFGISLFERTKNSIQLNNNGLLAAEEIASVLKRTDEMLARVRAYDRANRTISVGSAAAVQLPDLIRKLTEVHPQFTISTEMKKPSELTAGLNKNIYQLIVLPYKPDITDCIFSKIGEEHLMFLLPKKHHFAERRRLTLAEMDGENMLLYSEIGFWADIVKAKMPNSKFLVQTERYSFEELISSSVLPCFTTDLVNTDTAARLAQGRVSVPIEDDEVNVTYYMVCKRENRKMFSRIFEK